MGAGTSAAKYLTEAEVNNRIGVLYNDEARAFAEHASTCEDEKLCVPREHVAKYAAARPKFNYSTLSSLVEHMLSHHADDAVLLGHVATAVHTRILALRATDDGLNYAASLNNLSISLRTQTCQGKYAEAELSSRDLAISEDQLGPDRPDVAALLNNLSTLMHAQGKYAEAELLYRALAIYENQLGPDHPS